MKSVVLELSPSEAKIVLAMSKITTTKGNTEDFIIVLNDLIFELAGFKLNNTITVEDKEQLVFFAEKLLFVANEDSPEIDSDANLIDTLSNIISHVNTMSELFSDVGVVYAAALGLSDED